MNEADTCRNSVRPKLEASGWDTSPHTYNEQVSFTDGRIVVAGSKVRRRKQKRADFLLRLTRDFTIAVVEAKSCDHPAGDGLQQAKDYAEILGLKFAYATNGLEIIEFDYFTGQERVLSEFPTPEELWLSYRTGTGLGEDSAARLLSPSYDLGNRTPRYYQEIAINRAIQAILQEQRRVLLTMATGTGKTLVAFQICWKLWNHRWTRTGEHRRPKILFLADRNSLVDDPPDKTFAAFGDARHKIEGGEVIKSREVYFAIYQAIARDERRLGLYGEYAPDFFDLIVVDECHRGSARDESCWREILEYFELAYQLGLTATPLREENRDMYRLGLKRSYVPMQEDLQAVRGRINVRQTVTLHSRGQPRVDCSYEDYTIDVPENQLLLTALRAVSRNKALPSVRRSLAHMFTGEFPGVHELSDGRRGWAQVTSDRLNPQYEPALKMALLILQSMGIEHEFGTAGASGFTLDMNQLFEEFIACKLRKSLVAADISVKLQEVFDFDERKQAGIKPDLLFQGVRGRRVVADTKYKLDEAPTMSRWFES